MNSVLLTRLFPAQLLLCVAISATSATAQQVPLSAIERDLPDFDLGSVEGGQWDADSLAGKPWVINFWATWCAPCIEEIPSMNRGWAVLEDKGVGMLAINAGEDPTTVKQFLTNIPIDFPTLLGDGDTLPHWSVRVLPTTIVVDAKGQVVYEALGPREWDDEALLQSVIDLL
jgi:thiol-disulfide isomerase/thioredoxin